MSPDLLVRCTSDLWWNTHTLLWDEPSQSHFRSSRPSVYWIQRASQRPIYDEVSTLFYIKVDPVQQVWSSCFIHTILKTTNQPFFKMHIEQCWLDLTHAHTRTRTHTFALLLWQPSSRFLLPTPSLSIAVFPPTSTMSDSMATCGAFPYTCWLSFSLFISPVLQGFAFPQQAYLLKKVCLSLTMHYQQTLNVNGD